mmetsp:Transcript_58492/g.174066  ORF Transcript_58492/g.174066 Transcript_58492/m.174066 type:complete len:200 (+) Transcript_58492:332-931(+)
MRHAFRRCCHAGRVGKAAEESRAGCGATAGESGGGSHFAITATAASRRSGAVATAACRAAAILTPTGLHRPRHDGQFSPDNVGCFGLRAPREPPRSPSALGALQQQEFHRLNVFAAGLGLLAAGFGDLAECALAMAGRGNVAAAGPVALATGFAAGAEGGPAFRGAAACRGSSPGAARHLERPDPDGHRGGRPAEEVQE